MIKQYRKIPVVISAIQYTGENLQEVIGFTGKAPEWNQWFSTFDEYQKHVDNDGKLFKIFTLEGVMKATPGDYIIRGVNGEHYPCKPDIFEKTYEIVQ